MHLLLRASVASGLTDTAEAQSPCFSRRCRAGGKNGGHPAPHPFLPSRHAI